LFLMIGTFSVQLGYIIFCVKFQTCIPIKDYNLTCDCCDPYF
jgi:hypothetical protein